MAPARKETLSRRGKLLRLLSAVVDPRAYAHVFKIVNYYNYTHVRPLREIELGDGAAISPTASFANPRNIRIGRRAHIGAGCALWAGPGRGRIDIGDDILLAPNVFVTAANYRFNDGHPVTEQAMDEADVVIGDDVWLGANVVVLPGARIGSGVVVGAGAVVSGAIPPMAVAVGAPARVVGRRRIGGATASEQREGA